MPFLDISVELKDKHVLTTVHRKTTNTNVLLNNSAVAPFSWNKGLITCLLHRADLICSDEKLLREEHTKLKSIFFNNGYSNKMFEKIKQQHQDKKCEKTSREQNGAKKNVSEKNQIWLKVPYVGKISSAYGKRIKTLLEKSGKEIKITYKTRKVIESFVLKDRAPKPMESKVVYEFTCRGDPHTKYIGYTNRTLEKRVKEHTSGGSAISDHIAVCEDCKNKGVTIDDFIVLHRSHSKEETMVHEALAIKEKSPVLNKNLIKPGLTFTLMIF